MRQSLEVTYQDQRVEKVIAFYPDFVKFEERFDRKPDCGDVQRFPFDESRFPCCGLR